MWVFIKAQNFPAYLRRTLSVLPWRWSSETGGFILSSQTRHSFGVYAVWVGEEELSKKDDVEGRTADTYKEFWDVH